MEYWPSGHLEDTFAIETTVMYKMWHNEKTGLKQTEILRS